MATAREFRDKSDDELQALLIDMKRELFNMVNEIKRTKKAEHPDEVRSKRRDIAKLLTVVREKQLASE